MSETDLLEMTKANLQMASSAFDEFIKKLIQAAMISIREYGIYLNLDNIRDCNLVVMYTSYLFNKRKAENSGMPRMLQMAMHNRLFSEKMRGD